MQSFNDLTLSPSIMKAISELGYEKPSPVQAETLPLLLGDRTDFIGLAATGTGKTAAFSIPLLERLEGAKKSVQALILCPTRELALQVAGQIDLLGKFKGIKALPIYGGAGYHEQFVGLKRGASVIVGTPGRVIDHIEKGSLKLDQLQTLVLDEADEMISMGFKDELDAILAAVPRETANIWLFSATMSREVRRVADTYLKEPKQVQVNRAEMVPTAIEQLYYPTHEGNKPEVLCKLIDAAEDFYGIVFCQTKSLVTDLTQYLQDRGYKVDCLHGDKNQTARERTMQLFRDRKVNIMVCTDVAARGLDVKDITHVINYSLPRELDNYIHRIGRTARSGKTGVAMSLVTPSHRRLVFAIEKMTKSRMKEGRIPSRKEVATKKVSKLLTQFQEQSTFARAIELMDESWKTALATMSAEEVAGRFLALNFPEVFSEKGIAKMTNTSRASTTGAGSQPIRASDSSFGAPHVEHGELPAHEAPHLNRRARREQARSEGRLGAGFEQRPSKPYGPRRELKHDAEGPADNRQYVRQPHRPVGAGRPKRSIGDEGPERRKDREGGDERPKRSFGGFGSQNRKRTDTRGGDRPPSRGARF